MNHLKLSTVSLLAICFFGGCNGDGCRTPDECYKKGLSALQSNDRNRAYKFFAKAAHDEPTVTTYQWAAAKIATTPQLAYYHVKSAWEHGLRNRETFTAYLTLSSSPDQSKNLKFAMELYAQMPDSLRTDDMRARIYYTYKQYDSSVVIWKALFEKTPTSSLCNDIVRSYLKKSEVGNARSFLIKSQSMRLLDGEGYILLSYTYASDFDSPGCDKTFSDAKKAGKYNDTVLLAHVRSLIAREKIEEARETLRPNVPAIGSGITVDNQKVRIMMAAIGFARNDVKEIEAVKALVRGDVPGAEVEKELYNVLTRRLAVDTARIAASLVEIIKKLPESPELLLILARELANARKYNEALTIFQRLSPPYSLSPRCIVETARLLDYAGKDMEAVGMLNIMHRKNVFVKSSLELLRDIKFKQKNMEDAQKIQDVLKRQYSNDIGVRWASGMMAMKSGNLDSALIIFDGLRKRYPKEERFGNASLFAKYLKGDYEEVVKEISKDAVTGGFKTRLFARTLSSMKRYREADSIYRIAVAAKKDAGVMMEYADFLISQNDRAAEAAALYKEIIAMKSSKKTDSSAASAALLNNLAWSLLHVEGSDQKVVLSTVRQAYDMAKQNPSILDTYSKALFTYKNYRECIALLEKNPVTRKNGKLLVRLADAHEMNNNLNMAVRTLKEAEALPDSTIDKKMIGDRVSGILARIKE